MALSPSVLKVMAAALHRLPEPKSSTNLKRPLNLAALKPRNGEAKSLTHGQVQRRRKQLKKKNFMANVRYRKAIAL